LIFIHLFHQFQFFCFLRALKVIVFGEEDVSQASIWKEEKREKKMNTS